MPHPLESQIAGTDPADGKQQNHIYPIFQKLSTRQNPNKKGRRNRPRFRHPDFRPLEKGTDFFFEELFPGSKIPLKTRHF